MVRFHPDGRTIALTNGGGRIRFFDLCGRRVAPNLETGDREVTALAWSPCGTFLATAGHEDPDWPVIRVWYAGSPSPVPWAVLRGHTQGVRAVAFWGLGCVVTAGDDYTARLWSLARGRRLRDDPQSGVRQEPVPRARCRVLEYAAPVGALAIARDRPDLAVAADDQVEVWALRPRPRRRRQFRLDVGEPAALALSPSGDFLAAATWDGEVSWHDLRRGRQVSWSAGEPVLWVAFLGGGWVGWVDEVGRIRGWHPRFGRRRLGDQRWRPCDEADFSPDGRQAILVGENGRLEALPISLQRAQGMRRTA